MTALSDPGAKKILLVEDNADDVELTLRAFRKNDAEGRVAVARDGETALQYLFGTGSYREKPPPLPQVVLLDLKLPGTDGFEVLRRIREEPRTRFLPVVILTSSADETDLQRGYELGANSYIRKPVDFERFLETARQLGLYWLVLNLAPPPATPDEPAE